LELEGATEPSTSKEQYQRFKPQKAKKPKIDAVDAQLLELISKETCSRQSYAATTDGYKTTAVCYRFQLLIETSNLQWLI